MGDLTWARYKAKDDGTGHWFESKPNYYKETGQWCAKGQSAPANTENRNAAH